MKVGRNDPCLCGSGKKYKKCCLENEGTLSVPQTELSVPKIKTKITVKEHYFAEGESIGDYGEPQLNDALFDDENFSENSVQKFAYSLLSMPGLEDIAVSYARREISRNKDEEQRIKATTDIDELINIMQQNPDQINRALLKAKIVEQAEVAIPKVIDRLRQPHSESFIEMSIRIIREADVDCSAELIEIIKHPTSTVYSLSLLCLVLGFLGSDAAIKPLWDCYHFLKKRFPNETYAEGPLYGLSLLYYKSEYLDLAPEKIIELLPEKYRDKIDNDTAEQIKRYIRSEIKIAAIKLFREKTDASLIEAKDTIDAINLALIVEK